MTEPISRRDVLNRIVCVGTENSASLQESQDMQRIFVPTAIFVVAPCCARSGKAEAADRRLCAPTSISAPAKSLGDDPFQKK